MGPEYGAVRGILCAEGLAFGPAAPPPGGHVPRVAPGVWPARTPVPRNLWAVCICTRFFHILWDELRWPVQSGPDFGFAFGGGGACGTYWYRGAVVLGGG